MMGSVDQHGGVRRHDRRPRQVPFRRRLRTWQLRDSTTLPPRDAYETEQHAVCAVSSPPDCTNVSSRAVLKQDSAVPADSPSRTGTRKETQDSTYLTAPGNVGRHTRRNFSRKKPTLSSAELCNMVLRTKLHADTHCSRSEFP